MKEYFIEYKMVGSSVPLRERVSGWSEAQAITNLKAMKGNIIIGIVKLAS